MGRNAYATHTCVLTAVPQVGAIAPEALCAAPQSPGILLSMRSLGWDEGATMDGGYGEDSA